jgi:hypothetical protein
MILAHTRPSLFLPGLTFVWGGVVTLISLVKSKEGLIVARLFLGFVEYVIFHLSRRPCPLGKHRSFRCTNFRIANFFTSNSHNYSVGLDFSREL